MVLIVKNLTFDDFIKLLNGEDVQTKRLSFNVHWETLDVNIVENTISLYGLKGQPKTLFNTIDTNFKAISYPKAYPLIVYSNDSNLKLHTKPIYRLLKSFDRGHTGPTGAPGGKFVDSPAVPGVIYLPAHTKFSKAAICRVTLKDNL